MSILLAVVIERCSVTTLLLVRNLSRALAQVRTLSDVRCHAKPPAVAWRMTGRRVLQLSRRWRSA